MMKSPSQRATSASRLLAAIHDSPGVPASRVLRRLGLAAGTGYYHLWRLQRDGKITTVAVGRRRLLFPAPRNNEPLLDAAALAILNGHTAMAVARAVAAHGPVSILEIVERTQDSPRAVYYHMKRLRTAGLLTSAGRRRYGRVSATPKLHAMLDLLSVGDRTAPSPSQPSSDERS